MIAYKILCDQCKSDNVLHELKRFPPQPPEEVSMSDFISKQKTPSMEYAVYTYTHYILLCKECGYKKEYSV